MITWGPRTKACLALVLVTALGVLYAVDPGQHRLTPPCPYLALLGLACPGCGLTRATHALLHGDIVTAFTFNPWAFVATPALVAFATLPRVTGPARTLQLRTGISWVMLVVTLAFWVWRNLDVYPFTRV